MSTLLKVILKRRVDAEAWLVSDRFIERIAEMVGDLGRNNDRQDMPSFFENGEAAVNRPIEDLRKIARHELKVPPE